MDPKREMYTKRGAVLVKNLQKRHFQAFYCEDRASALQKAMELIPDGVTVGWGGAMSAQQIGLMDELRQRNVTLLDRDKATTPQERGAMMKQCLTADVFLTGANGLSLDGQMVNIDGNGNRVAAITFGPKHVILVVGINKVAQNLEAAISRARSLAAPVNMMRFADLNTPCKHDGTCHDCKSPDSICNYIQIMRNSHPTGRHIVVIVGEELGY